MNRKEHRQHKSKNTAGTNQMKKNIGRIDALTIKEISRFTGLTEEEINLLKRGEQCIIESNNSIGNYIARFQYKKNVLIIKSYIVVGKEGNMYDLVLEDGVILYNKNFNNSKYKDVTYSGSGNIYHLFKIEAVLHAPKELFSLETKCIDINEASK